MGKFVDLSGEQYGRLTVLDRGPDSPGGRVRWRCRCECGSEVIASSTHLRTGHTQSCGCLKIQKAKEHVIHGGNRRGQRERLYDVWIDMRRRCTNPRDKSYLYYGGRGISVCSEWASDYEAFRSWSLTHGYGPGLTLDRIDTDGNYTTENCRWVTYQEQNRNKRSNHLVEYDGKCLTLSEWEEITGIPQRLIRYRLVTLGWPAERALTAAIRGRARSEV